MIDKANRNVRAARETNDIPILLRTCKELHPRLRKAGRYIMLALKVLLSIIYTTYCSAVQFRVLDCLYEPYNKLTTY